MAEIHYLPPGRNSQNGAGVDGGGGSSDDGDMEKRIERLENIAEKTAEKLSAIEKDIAVLKAESSHYATREDVSNAKNSIIMWVVSAIFLAQLLPTLLKKLGM